ncbi:LysM peptidoglycan-binding domain-containing protein [Spirosoma endbachense]|uniref:LysM peptidoglycan-binding domain-containing protein n=1 Tax=Spirosoma endbachense TaxID=2666025 RepID=A0A6P1VVT2_9BACT|nr:LysM peptidoglycan-binding domain-containing protein [Spirosoma endbachense]QHV97213.1 LysM peptidoglycan-binding domain-containing protein [Spirosoma endbachense]
MKKYTVLIALLLLMSRIASAHIVADSVGVEKKDGKRFILHRVNQGQTLYAIARRYSSSVSAIKAANPTMGDAVRYAQIVRIPIPEGSLSRKQEKTIDKAIRKDEKAKERLAKNNSDATTKATAQQQNKEARKSNDPAKAGIHIVEPGQTLYSLAVRYGVAQSDLRKWNSLPGNNVLIGQALIVSEKAYQARTPSAPVVSVPVKTPNPAHPDTPTRTSPKPDRPTPKKNEETVTAKAENPTPRPDNAGSPKTENPSAAKTEEVVVEIPHPGNDAPMPTRGRRIATSGVAEMIEGDDSGKYLALHRKAPIGTLVQVRNEFNNQSLWVKVIGRLPDTGVNDKILIKLSTQAFAKLSPEDRRFRAEVSYIAP